MRSVPNRTKLIGNLILGLVLLGWMFFAGSAKFFSPQSVRAAKVAITPFSQESNHDAQRGSSSHFIQSEQFTQSGQLTSLTDNQSQDIQQFPTAINQNAVNAATAQIAAQTFDELIAKAQASGPVRIIIGVRAPFEPEGAMNNLNDVQLQRRAIAQAQSALLNRLAANNVARVTGVKQFPYIPFLAMEADASTLQYLQASADVTSIQEDKPIPPALAESVPLIGAPAAWASGFTGAGQVVAILDTGVDKTHPFLSGKVVSEACYSTTSLLTTSVCPGGVPESTDAGSGVNCAFPACEHGTHVAGIAAGKGATFSGVAKDANIIAIQVFSKLNTCLASGECITAFFSDLISGLQRVQTLSSSFNIAAVNLSLGDTSQLATNCDAQNSAFKTAVDNLRSIGIATVIAAGNGKSSNGLSQPACVSSAISVGSTGDGSNGALQDAVSSFSNSASILHLLAPGSMITSSIPGGGFANFQGTSMAAPHVTGAWAVLKSKTPNATVSQILSALSSTGLAVTDSRNSLVKPRIKVDAAVNALSSGSCAFTLLPTTQPFNSSGGTGTVNVTTGAGCAWTATSNDAWITITSGSSGNGNGTVNYAVAANTSLARTGTIFIAGQTFFVTQANGVAFLAVDDGTFENNVGLGGGGTSYRVNRLTPTSYPASINAVAIYFSNGVELSVGNSFTVLAGANPSGNSNINGISLQSTPANIQALGQFSVYPIPPITITSGDFVVGMRLTQAAGAFPFSIDQTAPSRQRSYRSSDGTTFAITDDTGVPGNYGIRALLALVPTISAASPATITAETCGTPNNVIDPGETVTVSFPLKNIGTASTTNLVATLLATGGVTAPSGPQTYGALPKGGSSATQSFTFKASPTLLCGDTLTATLQLQDGALNLGTVTFTLPVGVMTPLGTKTYSYSGVSVAIPDPGMIDIPITVTDTGIVSDVNVRVRLDHTLATDLELYLVSPDGATVELSTHNGGTGHNYGTGSNDCAGTFTVFDDDAATAITSASAPFAGTFKPETSLSALNGKAANGVWKLRVKDTSGGDSGTVGCWQLELTRQTFICCLSLSCPTVSGINPTTGTVGSTVTITGTSFTGVTAVKFSNNVAATFNVVNDTTMTATVPSGAITGPITVSKPGCDILTPSFTVNGPTLAPIAFAITAENCVPANNALDPGETVTVNLSLKNNGNASTTNLIATLQSTGGVTSPSGPQTYGVVTAGGTVTKPFTFTANGNCGGTLTATLSLQDGATNFGAITFTFTLGAPKIIFSENFDSVTAPALPASWITTVATGTAPPWVTSTTLSDTAPNNAFVSDPDKANDIRLDSPSVAITTSSAQLIFRHSYDLEATASLGFDGGVLEIAIGNAPFTDIITAGGSFVSGGYDHTITTLFGNPLGDRLAWSGSSGGYLTTTINLPASAAGQNIKLRWRMCSDISDGATGWRIDTIKLTDGVTCATSCTGPTCPTITLTPASLPAGTLGTAYNQTLAASPAGSYTFAVTTGSLPTGLSLNPATGTITGTPTAAGTSNFTITATNASNCTGSQSYTITIANVSSCIAVSIANTLTASPSSSLIVPITVGDLTGKNVASYDFTLSFDPAVLKLQSAPTDQTGTLSSGLTITPNTAVAGKISVSAFGTSPLSGAGTLLKLKFDVIGAANTCSDLAWVSFIFNEGTPCATTTNGRVCVAGGSLFGTVNYGTGTTPKPVPGVTLTAAGTPAGTSTTNSSGAYNLANLGGGPYTVTPTKTGDVNGISALDASLAAQHAAGLIMLSPNQQIAADASGNGVVTSFDAALIAQTAAGLPSTGLAGTWKFSPTNRNYSTLSGNQTNQNFDAILIGDVSGNWTPPASSASLNSLSGEAWARLDRSISINPSAVMPSSQMLERRAPNNSAITVSLPYVSGVPGHTVTIPITVGDLSGRGITAYDFTVAFDPHVLQLQSSAIDAAGTLSSSMSLIANTAAPGVLTVSAFQTAPLAGAGTLLYLKFTVVGEGGSSTSLTWSQPRAISFNEGEVPAALVNGRFLVPRLNRTPSQYRLR